MSKGPWEDRLGIPTGRASDFLKAAVAAAGRGDLEMDGAVLAVVGLLGGAGAESGG